MTHDELLEKMRHIGKVEVFYEALCAVVELHKPDKTYDTFCITCEEGRCGNAQSVEYPCPTIQAIMDNLK